MVDCHHAEKQWLTSQKDMLAYKATSGLGVRGSNVEIEVLVRMGY